jgi:hypothetical protein
MILYEEVKVLSGIGGEGAEGGSQRGERSGGRRPDMDSVTLFD